MTCTGESCCRLTPALAARSPRSEGEHGAESREHQAVETSRSHHRAVGAERRDLHRRELLSVDPSPSRPYPRIRRRTRCRES